MLAIAMGLLIPFFLFAGTLVLTMALGIPAALLAIIGAISALVGMINQAVGLFDLGKNMSTDGRIEHRLLLAGIESRVASPARVLAKFCSHCKEQLPDDPSVKFCPSCGGAI